MVMTNIRSREVQKALDHAIKYGDPKDLPWDEISKLVEDSFHDTINYGGRYLDEDTTEAGPKRWKLPEDNNQPLYRSGAFDRSIRTEIDSDGVTVGSPLDYPRYLQYGTRDMTERPWAVLTDTDEAAILDILKQHFGL